MSKARDLADSAQEINILDGKSFLDEDNLASDSATGIASQQSIKAYVDGITTTNITSTGALNSGSITSGFGNIDNGSSTITTTGAITGGSFVIGSADINENDLESIDGITAGTVSASKAVVVNTNKDITGFRNITATGTISGTVSGSLSSTTTATTQAESDDSTKIATTAYVTDKITTLIGGAPSTLNDLNELAAAINDDANYNSTLTTALATKLPLAGGTLTGNVTFGDNNKAIFGAGTDLQIYHDGTSGNTFIDEGGSGSLFIRDNDNIALKRQTDNANMVVARAGAEVELYHNGSEKLATTSTGVDVTGTVTSDGLTANNGGSNTNIRLQNTNSGSGSADGFLIQHATNAHTYVWNYENADTIFGTNGTERMRINSSGNVGIGISTIDNTYGASHALQIASISDNNWGGTLILSSADGSNVFSRLVASTDGLDLINTKSTNMRFYTANTERMRIDSSGKLLVGKTSAGYNVDGFEAHPNGETYVSRSGTPMAINRNSSDGTLLNFYKDGSTVGSIGTNGNQLYIASPYSNDSGLVFSGGEIHPCTTTGAVRDNGIMLGAANKRFSDVHAVNYHGSGANLTGISSGGTTFLGSVFVTNASASSISISNLDLTDYKQVYIVVRYITCSGSGDNNWFRLQSNAADNANGLIQGAGVAKKGTSCDITCDLASGIATSTASRPQELNNYLLWSSSWDANSAKTGGCPANDIRNSTTTISLHVRSGYNFAYASENMGTGDKFKRGMYLYGVK